MTPHSDYETKSIKTGWSYILMKSILSVIASAALLVGFATPGLALRPKPLNAPLGLAVDGLGNLYVANNGGHNILV